MRRIDNVEMLVNYGLTRQEATIYILLCLEGSLNGYEASKLSGASRSNTYSALAGLVEKGAAYVIQENSVIYVPVPIEEFCNNKIRYIEKLKDELIVNIPKKKEESDAYITIKSKRHIMDKVKNMVIDARERIYISMEKEKIQDLLSEMEIALKKGIKISIITEEELSIEGAKIYYGEKKPDQIRVIVDSKKVLTGDIKDENNSTCLYSTNNNLVQVFKEALSNEIKLIKIGEGRV